MNILVIGASGKTGQIILKHLSETNYSVTGLIRKREQKDIIKKYNVKPLLGDLENDMGNLINDFEAIIFAVFVRIVVAFGEMFYKGASPLNPEVFKDKDRILD